MAALAGPRAALRGRVRLRGRPPRPSGRRGRALGNGRHSVLESQKVFLVLYFYFVLSHFPLMMVPLVLYDAKADVGAARPAVLATTVAEAVGPGAGKALGPALAAFTTTARRVPETGDPFPEAQAAVGAVEVPVPSASPTVPTATTLLRPRATRHAAVDVVRPAWNVLAPVPRPETCAEVVGEVLVMARVLATALVLARVPGAGVAGGGHVAPAPDGERLDAPRPNVAVPFPVARPNAKAVAATGTSVGRLVEVPPLALAGQAARPSRHAATDARLGTSEAMRPTPTDARALPYETLDGALLRLATGLVAPAEEVLRDEVEVVATHAANGVAVRGLVAPLGVPLLLPGLALGPAVETKTQGLALLGVPAGVPGEGPTRGLRPACGVALPPASRRVVLLDRLLH